MHFSGNEVHSTAAARVKVCVVRLLVDIYGNEHAFAVCLALPDALLVGEHKLLEAAVAERAAFAVRLCHCGDTGGQVVLDRLLERGAQSVIAVLLFALGTPLAAIVDARNAGHAEQQRVDQRQMRRILQDGRNARDVVVIHKRKQVLAFIQRPVFRTELAQQRMRDLEQVVAVHRGIQTLVALVIRAGVQHAVSDKLVVIAVEQFADEEKVGRERVAEAAQRTDEILVETVRHVQPQTVNAEFVLPLADTLENVVLHIGVAQIELYQLEMTFPALVPEAVIVV